MAISDALLDPELGITAFTVERTSYRRHNGTSVPSNQTLSDSGCIHPGTPEMVQLLPEEEWHEEFIAVYTDFPLSLGENSGERPIPCLTGSSGTGEPGGWSRWTGSEDK